MLTSTFPMGMPADATATAADIRSGKTAYVNGAKITGTIPSQGAQTITPGTANKTIAAGKYLSGAQTIKGDQNLKAENIAEGVSIFGVTGTHAGGEFKSASGGIELSYSPSQTITVTGLEFTPKVVIIDFFVTGTVNSVKFVIITPNIAKELYLSSGGLYQNDVTHTMTEDGFSVTVDNYVMGGRTISWYAYA